MILGGFVPYAYAASANVSWSPSSSSGVTGYKVLYGTSSGSYTQSVDAGSSTNYTLSGLNDGTKYYFAAVAYNSSGVQSGYSNEASYTTPAASQPGAAYTLTASAGTGGSISPSGSVGVSQGANQTFTITPSSGYSIADVKVDGVSMGAVSSYTFNNITADHTIQASFSSSSSPSVGSLVFAANAGGPQYKDSSGVTYAADSNYSGGAASIKNVTVTGTSDPVLYQTERYGNFSYNIPVANGNYSVRLRFAETYWSAAGKRVFSVKINGKTVISNLDLYAKVGKNKGYGVTLPVNVTNGTLKIEFIPTTNNATVSGIEVKTS